MRRMIYLLVALSVIATVANASVLTFEGTGTNIKIPASWGSNIAADGTGFNVSNGATPNVALTWSAELGATQWWEFFNDIHWAGVAQLNYFDPGISHYLTFSPDEGYGVFLDSFVFDDYASWQGGNDFSWNLYEDAAGGTVIASGSHITTTDGQNLTVNTGMSASYERTIVLEIINNGPAGEGSDQALDDITFRQEQLSAPPGPPLQPYLQTPTPNSIWVSWDTSTGIQSTVEYGLAAESLDQSIDGSYQTLKSNYNFHSVQLAGLTANTFYFYRVVSGAESSPVYRFKTPPDHGTNTGHIRFLIVGDHQTIPRHQTILERAKETIENIYGVPIEECINAVINDGDQVNHGGTLDEYRNMHFGQCSPISGNIPTMTTVGNHETYGDSDLGNYKAHFHYNETAYGDITNPSPGQEEYYAWQIGNVVVMHLNTDGVNATQTQWVQNNIDQIKTDPDVDWVMSIGHRPYQAEQWVGDISNWVRNTLAPIFGQTEKHVLTIGGHHHLYARGQVREYPMYHMISGGTSGGQVWGQASESDFDDVQKTISNWAWQIIDFDLDTKKMEVRCFSEGLPPTGFIYDNKEIDRFHRQFDLPAPDKPSLTAPASPIELSAGSYTFASSDFSTSSGESLNSVHFQISNDPAFGSFVVDRIKDVENFYTDTGTPDYLPVDLHAGINIIEHTLAQNSLSSGTHYIRVRHRDTNVLWSPWSDVIPFEIVSSSTDPGLSLSKNVYGVGETITAQWSNGPGGSTDWLGIYDKGDLPGQNGAATEWYYISSGEGTHDFNTTLVAGNEYFIGYFINDGYTEIAPRVPFYIGPVPLLSSDKATYEAGENVVINWENAQGNTSDWIGIYKTGDVPGLDAPMDSASAISSAGTYSINGLASGSYLANYFVNGGYFSVTSGILFIIEFANFGVTAIVFNADTGEVTLSWDSPSSHTSEYVIQESIDLGMNDPWSTIPGEESIPITGDTVIRTFSAGDSGPQHFYRVILK